MQRTSVDHKRLMSESTDRVRSALYSENPNEQLVASRLLESPEAFRTWESEHSGLMREVANPSFRRTQAALLKKVEELTLYLIDENKKVQVQQDRIDQQQKEIDELKKLIAEKK